MTKPSSPRRRVTAGLLAGSLAVLAAGPGGAALQAPAAQGSIVIEHQAPACVQAGKYARVDACFRPASALARARVYFRKGGTTDWFYVEMAPNAPCHSALLPRPKKDVGRIEYYVSATDRRSAEARTKDATLLVSEDGRCSAGPLAPIADSGSVVIGSATGAAPAGFATGGGLSPLLIGGGAAVVAGGAAAVIVGGNDPPPPPPPPPTTTTTTTTTQPPTPTTTTTTTQPPTPTTTTTTTQPPTPTTTTTTTTTTMPCETPNQPPSANIVSPPTGPIPNPVTVVATAVDPPGPGSGIREVRFSFQYCPNGVCAPEVQIGIDNTGPSPYTIVWANQPSCAVAPEDRFRILARAVDLCGNVSVIAPVDVRSVGRGCFRAAAAAAQSGAWLSDLQAPGARGQVVVDGAQAVFPSAGTESYTTPLGPGPHRFEATLVDQRGGDGRRSAGVWRFDLSSLRLTPGSLRVVAGEVAQVAGDVVVFRLRGRAGERVVFGFDVAGQ